MTALSVALCRLFPVAGALQARILTTTSDVDISKRRWPNFQPAPASRGADLDSDKINAKVRNAQMAKFPTPWCGPQRAEAGQAVRRYASRTCLMSLEDFIAQAQVRSVRKRKSLANKAIQFFANSYEQAILKKP